MITHCPECGEALRRNYINAPTYNTYLCHNTNPPHISKAYHYEITYCKKEVYSKYRIMNIGDIFYCFHTIATYPVTKISLLDFDPMQDKNLYISNEFIGDVDEIEFTKRILNMKVFI